jgi:GNAT superfamily N-acetyltransferase
MIEIRRVRPEEAEAITEIALAAKRHWGYPERWMQLWAPELTFSPEYFEANENWAALADGKPIGFYTLQVRDGQAWLGNLFVKPAYMGRGVGRALWSHALDEARQRGFRLLRFESDPNAVGFYEKMRAHQVGERRSEVDGQPRVLPVLEIEL